MIRTIVSIIAALAIVAALSFFEMWYVHSTFETFRETLLTLQEKVELEICTVEDGRAVQQLWDEKKKILHVWLPHTSLQEIDFQLDEAVGFIYTQSYEDAIPKIEVLIGLSEHLPMSYSFDFQNIF